ncbi:hypothetical protein J9303_04690 [Bacillaceae bacterium Marseille-Q3522]|nr:hypothetical protein [Bacillaceae bacterium Marseille-Q3522]
MGKEILSLLQRDIMLGFYSIRYRWLFSMGVILMMLLFSLYDLIQSAPIVGYNRSTFTYTDLLFPVFKGEEFQMPGDPGAKFPVPWFFMQIIGPFIFGGYMREDFFQQSSFLFIRAKHRFSIWISKLIFAVVVVLSMYLLIAVMTALLSFSFLSFSPAWSDYGEKEILPKLSLELSLFAFTIHMLLLPFCMTVFTVIIQAVLSVFMRPIYAFLVIAALLAVSVYSTSRFLPGSYSMILRNEAMAPGIGYSWGLLFIYIAFVLLAVVCGGYMLFKKMDIFPKEGD